MKRIIIKQLRITNFKGIRSLTIDFQGLETSIRGANGTGKTTVFDAFTWLLFGKDSHDRQKFHLKTLDSDGNEIPKLPHEVSAVIDVEGEEITLKRCFTEVWVKRRGGKEEFDHNEGERYYNDVPCGDREFQQKISDLCSEQRFKELTNPFYFTSQSKDYQRKALIAMAGDVSDDDVTDTNPERFAKLLDELSRKSIDELEKQLAVHKRKVKEKIADLEPRLDEKKKDISEFAAVDYKGIEKEIDEKKARISEIDKEIADTSAAYDSVAKERTATAKELAEERAKYTKRQSDLKDELLKDYRKELSDYRSAKSDIDAYNADIDSQIRTLKRRLESASDELRQAKEDKVRHEGTRFTLLNEYRQIKAREFDPNNAVCPTCGRPYDTDKTEALKEKFVSDKNDALVSNKEKGVKNNERIKDATDRISLATKEIEDIKAKASKLAKKSYDTLVMPTEPDIEIGLATDNVSLTIKKHIEELKEQLSQDVEPADVSEQQAEKQKLSDEVITLSKKLAQRDEMKKAEDRASEIEDALTANRNELEEVVSMESTIFDFNKAKMEMLQAKIDSKFKYARFKMYDKLQNGELQETCECMIDGVPYSDLNSAARINVGIDIINAISRSCDMSAPIFIDNRESVTSIISTDAQVISLVVDPDCKELLID